MDKLVNKLRDSFQKVIFGEPAHGEKVNLNPIKIKVDERTNNMQDYNKWIYSIHTNIK